MKLIKKDSVQVIAKNLNCRCDSERTELVLLFLPKNKEATKDILNTSHVSYKETGNLLEIRQEELFKLYPEEFEDVNAWNKANKDAESVELCKELSCQRLSNIVHLLEILLVTNSITREKSDYYLKQLEENIVPELEQKFHGNTIPYEPYYEWEKTMYEKYLTLTNSEKV